MADANAITHKACTKCMQNLPISMFSKCGQGLRRRGTCKDCTSEIERARKFVRRELDGPKPKSMHCVRCNVLKLFDGDNFKTRDAPWGLSKECKACHNIRSRKWNKTDKGRAVRLKSEAKNKLSRAARAKKYQAKNRAKINAYVSVWRSRNLDRNRENDRLWKRKNKDKAAEYRHNRRAAGAFDRGAAKNLLVLQKFRCVICRTSIRSNYEIDHITPVIRGGSNDISNLQLLCMRCNRRKGANDPIQYMNSLGFLL